MVFGRIRNEQPQKICEIKYEKNTIPAGHQTRTIPLKAVTNGQQLNELCLIFVRVPSEHCQLSARIDGIDRGFLFGNAAAELSPPGRHPLPLTFGNHSGKQILSPSLY